MLDHLDPPSLPPNDRLLGAVVAEGRRRRRIAARWRVVRRVAAVGVPAAIAITFVIHQSLAPIAEPEAPTATTVGTTSLTHAASTTTADSAPAMEPPAEPRRRHIPPPSAGTPTHPATTIDESRSTPPPATAPAAGSLPSPTATTPTFATVPPTAAPTTPTTEPHWSPSTVLSLALDAPYSRDVAIISSTAGTHLSLDVTNAGDTALGAITLSPIGDSGWSCTNRSRPTDAVDIVLPGEHIDCSAELAGAPGLREVSVALTAVPLVPADTAAPWPTEAGAYRALPGEAPLDSAARAVVFGSEPRIDIVAAADLRGAGAAPAGGTVTATVTAINVGNTALTDLSATGIACERGWVTFDGSSVLLPGEAAVCTNTAQVLEGANEVAASVTASPVLPADESLSTGTWPRELERYTGPIGSPVQGTTTLVYPGVTGAIDLRAEVCLVDNAGCPTAPDTAWTQAGSPPRGQTPMWRIVVTNAGTTPLSDVLVSTSTRGCEAAVPRLDPNASTVVVCTATSSDRPQVLTADVSAVVVDHAGVPMPRPGATGAWSLTATASAEALL